ncbi:glycosyltransferase [Sphingomonas sp. BK069]|uniref:glycosyltransferase n=1 Tax=Sphingomonas sp. BK069 TaxID=2586979 RepID=UPI00162138E6|nr:glycosyltransferase [Sphingomonas sp. BK069]MBB3349113.1 UDP:flavonoid glycosyltransferase YjiC (YdhE family) [Sphingomonas sp. BK069]
MRGGIPLPNGFSPSGHIAIITAPLAGHVNPVQVLARALEARGWRVSLVHMAAAEGLVTDPALGFSALPGGAAAMFDAYIDTLVEPTGPVRLTRMIRASAAMTGRLLDEAPAVLERTGVTAVLADAVEPAGPLIAQKLNLPYAVATTGLPLLGEPDVPPAFLGWRYRSDRWGRFRNRGGYAVTNLLMRPITRVVETRRRQWGFEEGAAPRVQVAQCPRGLDYPRRSLPSTFLYGSPWRSEESHEPALPDDGPPLVFCSLGTLQGSRRALFATMAQACAAIGARAVIGHGGGLSRDEESALPGDPLVRAFWPQTAVLRRCSAAVLHGGFNTVLDALSAGVPIVALPIGFEQPATAARIVRLGAGQTLSPRRLSSRTLANALREVIDQPSYARAARGIAAEIAAGAGAPGAADAITAALATPA